MECNQRALIQEKCNHTPKKDTPVSSKSDDSGYLSYPSSSPRGRQRMQCHSYPTDRCNISLHLNSGVLDEGILSTAAATPKIISRQRLRSFGRIPKLRLNEFVDFIQELSLFPHMIKLILSYLSPHDLCAVNCVTRGWKDICCSDPVANRRRLEFLKQEYINRADLGKENECAKHERSTPTTNNSTPLQESGNVLVAQAQLTSPIPLPRSQFQKFVEAGQALPSDGRLTPCIHCASPSRMSPGSSRASCLDPSCAQTFCVRCWQQYQEPHNCAHSKTPPKRANARISSKLSKKNLQRLAR